MLAVLIMLAIIGCAPKEKKTDEPKREDTLVEQESTAPRNGIVLEDESGMSDDDSGKMPAEDEKVDRTNENEETTATEESNSNEKQGIVAKAETGDLIQPAGVDSAIEIP